MDQFALTITNIIFFKDTQILTWVSEFESIKT
jgi:hypothetical protein